jgi:hypothetical protein
MTLLTCLILALVGIPLLGVPAFSGEPDRAEMPGFNAILDEAVKGEGGVQVYVDKDGNIGTVIDAGPGHRTFSVQPPPSLSRNLGPPLQLHNKPLSLPIAPSSKNDTSSAAISTR